MSEKVTSLAIPALKHNKDLRQYGVSRKSKLHRYGGGYRGKILAPLRQDYANPIEQDDISQYHPNRI